MRMQVRKANGCLGSRKPRCGVVEVELDRWRGRSRWFGLVGLKRMLGLKYRTFSPFEIPTRRNFRRRSWSLYWGRGQARPGNCLLVLRLRMSHSFRTLSHGAPPVACRPVLLFGQVGLGSGVQQGLYARAAIGKRENARACLGAVSWVFVVFSISLTIAPSTSAATPVRHFSHSHASICALFCAFRAS